MIPVTKPFLPSQAKFNEYLNSIWERQWLTNMGPLSNELEYKLQKHLNVQQLLFVTNGTVALQMAIKALDLKGEIITTPFSFVATTSSIAWEGCTPVFVDIDKTTFNIDPTKIEEVITERTSAILATHVYGNPCDVLAIERIAQKHNLKVIYDGAHAFGVKVEGRSIFEYGDVSTCSLHATKLYHAVEGGLVFCNDADLYRKLRYIRNFGISGFETFAELGLNGKNSEFHAAMGLVNLDYLDLIHEKRKTLTELYNSLLRHFSHYRPEWHKSASLNYAYYPILLPSEEKLLKVVEKLKDQDIQTRRYFYPSLANSLPYIPSQSFSITDDIAKRVLCLPLYYDLTIEEVQKICKVIIQS